MNSSRCISFLTQTKTIVPDEYKRKIGNRLYGCDTCQVVCPKNKGLNWTQHEELQPDPELVKPLLLPLLEMSNKEYKRVYGRNASSWRGKKPIQRNAVIALGNFKDASAIGKLTQILLEDEREVLRESAAWALGRIGGSEALDALENAIKTESHLEVLEAIDKAIQQIKSEEIHT